MAVGTGPRSTKSGSRKKGATGKVPGAARGGTTIGKGNKADSTGLEPPPPTAPHTNPLLNKQVSTAVAATFRKIKERREARAGINAEIKALREALVARGLNKHAIDDLFRYWLKDDNQRDGYDQTWEAGRSAIGLPIQAAFDLPDPESGTAPPETSGKAPTDGNGEAAAPPETAGAAAGDFKPTRSKKPDPETASPEAVH